MTPAELKSSLEAIIYAADEPATIEQLAAAIGEEKHVVRTALDELVASYASDERGIEMRAVAGGYRYYTKPQHHDAVRRFIKSLRPPLRLTMPALETLAVIAYKQPVTQPEIQEIRGVACAGVLQTLLEKRLVVTAGRKAVVGRPILYRTSKDFLMRFGLSGVDELPSLKEFEALAREALGADDGVAAEEMPAGDEGILIAAEAGVEAIADVPEAAMEAQGEAAVAPEAAAPAEATTAVESTTIAESITSDSEEPHRQAAQAAGGGAD
jgi:segregation and condensation protein B